MGNSRIRNVVELQVESQPVGVVCTTLDLGFDGRYLGTKNISLYELTISIIML